MNNEYVPLLSE